MKKTTKLALLLLAVLVCFIFLLLRMYYVLTPVGPINGVYQSDHAIRPMYTAQFYGDKFYIEKSGLAHQTNVISQGTFQLAAEGEYVYLLQDQLNGCSYMVTLEHKRFYYYDETEDLVIRLDLKIPLSAPASVQAER